METLTHALGWAWDWASWLLIPASYWKWRRRRWQVQLGHQSEGVVVYARRWPRRAEVGRVGHDRPTTANPDKDFNEQFGVVMARAKERCSALNAATRNVRSQR